MAEYNDLMQYEKNLVHELVQDVLKALSPDDPNGHIPNCGYTKDHQICGCADFGTRLYERFVNTVYKMG